MTNPIKPKKKVYGISKQLALYSKMKILLKKIFESDKRIKEIRLFGSAIKKEFGVYEKIYKPGTPTARKKTDIDTVFLIEDIKPNKANLKNGYKLQSNRFMKNRGGKTIQIEGHPVMIAVVTNPEDYYKNIKKPYPKGYKFSEKSKILFKREFVNSM